MRDVSPHRKASNMAEAIGCSRERVRQVLNKLKLPTSFRPIHACRLCKKPIPGVQRVYCSDTCRKRQYRIFRICIQCGEHFQLLAKRIAYEKRMLRHPHYGSWCSNRCQGQWLGLNYGKGAGKQTHCKRGHELEDPNLYYYTRDGITTRACRACTQIRSPHVPTGNPRGRPRKTCAPEESLVD